jgi:hypothetical protein
MKKEWERQICRPKKKSVKQENVEKEKAGLDKPTDG